MWPLNREWQTWSEDIKINHSRYQLCTAQQPQRLNSVLEQLVKMKTIRTIWVCKVTTKWVWETESRGHRVSLGTYYCPLIFPLKSIRKQTLHDYTRALPWYQSLAVLQERNWSIRNCVENKEYTVLNCALWIGWSVPCIFLKPETLYRSEDKLGVVII